MPLPAYYHELYVALCAADGRIRGSGICYDGYLLLTCAHVVNSAAGRSQTDTSDATGLEVQLRFSQSPTRDRQKKYRAKVTVWGPASAPVGTRLTPRYDVAVLEITETDDLADLPAYTAELRFVAADLPDHEFSCISHNTLSPDEDTVPVNGTISHYLPAEGKTTLNTSDNPNDPFLKPGASGSPVYSEVLDGIAGIADQLIDDKVELKYGFMVDARCLKKIADIAVEDLSEKKKKRENNKYKCDRDSVISGIKAQRLKTAGKKNLFFFYGNDNQEGLDFGFRYEMDFVSRRDKTNSRTMVKVALNMDISNADEYRIELIERLSWAASRNRRLNLKTEDDIFKVGELFKHLQHKIFLFHIFGFRSDQSECLRWFFRDFLRTGSPEYPEGLHVLVFLEFSSMESDPKQQKEAILRLFDNPPAFELEDVSKPQISRWIADIGIIEDSSFILKLKELLDDENKDRLPMRQILDKYNDAVNELPQHERL